MLFILLQIKRNSLLLKIGPVLLPNETQALGGEKKSSLIVSAGSITLNEEDLSRPRLLNNRGRRGRGRVSGEGRRVGTMSYVVCRFGPQRNVLRHLFNCAHTGLSLSNVVSPLV